MNIIIVGAGRIGRNLSKLLSAEDHQVYLIENNKEDIQRFADKLDVKMLYGSGSDPDVLKKANIERTDLVLAVTTSDETNLIICSLATMFGAKRCIARVRKTVLRDTLKEAGYEKFGISELINPELVAADTVAKIVQTPGASETAEFAEGKILLRGFDIKGSSPLNGIKVSDLGEDDFPWPFLIVSVVRKNNVVIVDGDTKLEERDHIYVLLPAFSLPEFLTFIDPEIKMPKKVVIYGATFTGRHVAMNLVDKVKNIVIIEEDKERAEKIALRLDEVTVLHGSGTDVDLLAESGIDVADVFVAASKDDHGNFISSVLAKNMGAKQTIIVTQQPDYMIVADSLNVDAIISPHVLAADHILKLVRGRNIRTIAQMMESETEAMELVVGEGAGIVKDCVKNLKFPKGAILGAVCKGRDVQLANGKTRVCPGDEIIIFCKQDSIKKVQQFCCNSIGQ